MRRRSDRKKSTDISSPAPASRRSSRRSRKSPSVDRGNEELEEVQENDRQQRESSEEHCELPRRGSRSMRNRTPLRGESPATTPAKRRGARQRELSPEVAMTKSIDPIPEEENGQSIDEQEVQQSNRDDIPLSRSVVTLEIQTVQQQPQNVEEVEPNKTPSVAIITDDCRDAKAINTDSPTATKNHDSPDGYSQSAVLDLNGPAVCGITPVDPQETAVLDIHPTETGEILLTEERKSITSSSDDAETLDKIKQAVPIHEQVEHHLRSSPYTQVATTNEVHSAGPVDVNGSSITALARSKPTIKNLMDDRGVMDNNNHNNNNVTSHINIASDNNGRTTLRKRKWLTKKGDETRSVPVLAISTDSLKNLISDVHPVPLSDVQLDSSSEVEQVTSEREEGEESPSPERERRSSIEELRRSNSNRNIIGGVIENSKVVGDTITAVLTGTGGGGSFSPPNNRTSSVLYITDLVRPFTVLQLKGLLARTGKITENGFWIDRIKSKCFVEYENEDEASETRHALNGVRWPVSNPKCLSVEFGEKADLIHAIETSKNEVPKFGQDNNKDNVIVGQGWRGDRTDLDLKKNAKPVREWDVGKKDSLDREKVRPSKDRDASEGRENHKQDKDREFINRARNREGRSHSLSPVRKIKKKDDPPLRLLDDLFRKTKTTPCIYWLPLTPEQIAEKEAFRQKRIEEHKERLKQRELERDKEREKERARANDRERDRDNRDRDRRNRSSDRRRSRSRDRRRY